MAQRVDIRFPKVPLLGVMAFICASVIVVGAARLSGMPASPGFSGTAAVESRSLRFEDAEDGSVLVYDDQTNTIIAVAEPGTNGFLRGALRALNRARKRSEASFAEPFRLERWSNGQLILIDTHDGITIDLKAFGPTNAAVFETFLKPSGGSV